VSSPIHIEKVTGMEDEKKDEKKLIIPNASDIGDMMADIDRQEMREGTRIQDYIEKDDYGHKTYTGRRL